MTMIWLPRASFQASVDSLTDPDLAVLRLDILLVLEALHETEETDLPDDHRWDDNLDKLVAAWRGYEMQLAEYGLVAVEEFSIRTRRRDSMIDVFTRHMEYALSEECAMGKPPWFGDSSVHLSHQAALVRHNHQYRRDFEPDASIELVWPVSDLG